eukprot:2912933-Lingulodinium_polyedra.AAC.1
MLNVVHGGEPITIYGRSSSIMRLARRLSSATRKFQDLPHGSSRRSNVEPGIKPSLGRELIAAVTLGGE